MGKDLPLPGCNNQALCTLAQFTATISKFIPADYTGACKVKNPLVFAHDTHRPTSRLGSPILHQARQRLP